MFPGTRFKGHTSSKCFMVHICSWHLVMVTSSHMESLMTAFSACLNLDTSRARPACRSRRRSARSIDDTLWMQLVNWTLFLGFSASSFSFSSSSTTSSCCLVPQRRAPLVWWCRIFNLQSTLSLETCKCCHWRTAKYGIFQHNVENGFHPQNSLQTSLLRTASLHQEPFHFCLALVHSSSSSFLSSLDVLVLPLQMLSSSYFKSMLFYVTLKSFSCTMLIERKPGSN